MTTPAFCTINGCGQTATHEATVELGPSYYGNHTVSATITVCERHANALIDAHNTAIDQEQHSRLVELLPIDQ